MKIRYFLSLILIGFCFMEFSLPCIAYPKSDHYDGKRFHNMDTSKGKKDFLDVLKWKCLETKEKWPYEKTIKKKPTFPLFVEGEDTAVTFIGHSTCLIQLKGLTILTDPVFSDRIGPITKLGVRRLRVLEVAIEELPKIDVVLISHNHYDHFDIPSIKELWKRYNPLFIVPLKNGALLRKLGIDQIIELDWWEDYILRDRQSVILTPAQHWSARGLFDHCKALWGGFVVFHDQKKIFFAGDSGYATHFKEISRRFGPMDISLIPIGAYEPRWFMEYQHMNPEEAVQAHLDLESKFSLGIHFGSFSLADEGVCKPQKDLEMALKKLCVEPSSFIAPLNGQTFQNL